MERLTIRNADGDVELDCNACQGKCYYRQCALKAKDRLADIEDILGGSYDLDRLRELAAAIKQLEAEYERAKGLAFVRNPLAYALYHTWKAADRGKLKAALKARETMENRCVCCGEIIPEGRQVCSSCENSCGSSEKKSGWISVKDALPEPGTRVLCFWEMFVSFPVETGASVVAYYPGSMFWNHVTYWMPLPEPPEVVE